MPARRAPTTNGYDGIVDRLLESANPILRYKTLVHVLGARQDQREVRMLRDSIKASPIAEGLRADVPMTERRDRSWVSALYTAFKHLADIHYPPGDASLEPYRDHLHEWLHSDSIVPLRIKDKYRLHGSAHGNVIYASVQLGIANEQTQELCEELLRYQWPGGGWNCSKLGNAVGPTIVHTAYGMRGLESYRSVRDSPELEQAVERCAEILLERQVYLSRKTAKPLRPIYAKLTYPYPRLYNFMAGLHILTRAGRVRDPRCAKALDVLESTFIEGQGWPMERKPERLEWNTHAHWERDKLGKASPFLTVDALEILKEAGRFVVSDAARRSESALKNPHPAQSSGVSPSRKA